MQFNLLMSTCKIIILVDTQQIISTGAEEFDKDTKF